MNAAIVLPETFIWFLLGTSLYVFYKLTPELLSPNLPTDSIFPHFISQQLPSGVTGIVIAALFAASMSTLDSGLNSVSTAVVTDFYARFHPESTDAFRLRLARWLTAGLGLIATATAATMATYEIQSLWDLFMRMLGLLSSGMAGLFAVGMFTSPRQRTRRARRSPHQRRRHLLGPDPNRRQLLPVRCHRPAHLLCRRLHRQPPPSRPPQNPQRPDRLHPNAAGTNLITDPALCAVAGALGSGDRRRGASHAGAR